MGLDRYHTKRPLHDPLAALVCIFQHREPREIVHIPPSPSLDEIVAVLHYYHFSRDALPLKCPALTDSLFDPILQSTHLPLIESFRLQLICCSCHAPVTAAVTCHSNGRASGPFAATVANNIYAQ